MGRQISLKRRQFQHEGEKNPVKVLLVKCCLFLSGKKSLVKTFKVRHFKNRLATFLNNFDMSMLKAALRDNKFLLNMQVKCLLFIYFLHHFFLGIRKSGA